MRKIAINGFGRIGRIAYRALLGSNEFEVVAINDFSSPEELSYLLKYDTVHRTLNEDVTYTEAGILVNGKLTKCLNIKEPALLPWGELGVDCVLECTGAFTSYEKAMAHINAGAGHVVISAPAKGEMKTIVFGVNDNILDGSEAIISAASCTTNCLAPVLKVIETYLGIESGFMTTVHAYTNDQATLDGTHSKGITSRRGRAAAANIVPASTGAANAIGEVIPELKGKLDGTAFRVPVSDGSVIDLSLVLKRATSVEELNGFFAMNANGVLKFTMDPVVSSDVIGNNCGALIDGLSTTVLDENKQMVKVVAWYDNEYGYTIQMLRTMEALLNKAN